ncbi:hypothetical protein [Streptomyces asiaticus]|uniref:hypothetical protein n=1 Tax=Streptomyces asiaticus TaxID=114695 RepID=UPI00383049FC
MVERIAPRAAEPFWADSCTGAPVSAGRRRLEGETAQSVRIERMGIDLLSGEILPQHSARSRRLVANMDHPESFNTKQKSAWSDALRDERYFKGNRSRIKDQ